MRNGKSRYLATLIIALLALALRWRALLMLPADYDEPIYMLAAQHYAAAIRAADWNQLLTMRDSVEHPALVKLLYGIGSLLSPQQAGRQLPSQTSVTGQPPQGTLANLSVGRSISVFFGTLQVALLAFVSPLAGFLLAIHTMTIKYTSQAYLEALPACSSLLAVLAYERSTHPKRPANHWLVVSAIALGVTAASKYTYLVAGLAIAPLLVWHNRRRLWAASLFLGIALLTFLVLDVEVWADPVGRLIESVFFHPAYSQSLHVQSLNLPWWQQFYYLAHSVPWHPGVFLLSWDSVILALGVLGLPLLARRRPVSALWLVLGVLALLIWPTKWPQYTLIVTAPLCLSASALVDTSIAWLDQRSGFVRILRSIAPDRGTVLVAGAVGLAILAGLSYVQWQSLRQMQDWVAYSTRDSALPSDNVRALAVDSQERVWAGTDRGAALLQNGQWVAYSTANSGLVHDSVRAVAVDPAGRVWFGTDGGVSMLAGGQWHSYTTRDSPLLDDHVLCLAAVPATSTVQAGALWIGTEQGASYFDGDSWLYYTPGNSGLIGARVLSITCDARGRTWFGTWGGLSAFDGSNWTSYTSQNSGLAFDTVASVAMDAQGRIWCGTLDGVSVLDGESWRTYEIGDLSLRFNTATALAVDRRGQVWVGADLPYGPLGAVAVFDGQKWHDYSQYFSGTRQAPVRAIVADSEGGVWFATVVEGILVYHDPKTTTAND